MPYRLALLAGCAALALAGCASDQEIAAKRCSNVAGPTHDQCVAQELARLAKAQELPQTGGGGGGGGGY
jgi:hypothetical protein